MSTQHATAAELRRMLPGSLERHRSLEQAVLDYLAIRKIPAFPIYTGPQVGLSRSGRTYWKANKLQRGAPDIFACLPPDGRAAFLECKTGGAGRSPAQVEMARRFRRAGALCVIVRDVRDVEAVLS